MLFGFRPDGCRNVEYYCCMDFNERNPQYLRHDINNDGLMLTSRLFFLN